MRKQELPEVLQIAIVGVCVGGGGGGEGRFFFLLADWLHSACGLEARTTELVFFLSEIFAILSIALTLTCNLFFCLWLIPLFASALMLPLFSHSCGIVSLRPRTSYAGKVELSESNHSCSFSCEDWAGRLWKCFLETVHETKVIHFFALYSLTTRISE